MDRWRISVAVPESISAALRTARELTTQAFVRQELMPVAVTWTWATLEAALRDCLGIQDEKLPSNLLREAEQQGLLIPRTADTLRDAYIL